MIGLKRRWVVYGRIDGWVIDALCAAWRVCGADFCCCPAWDLVGVPRGLPGRHAGVSV
jgi:hypothetical protein